MQPLGLGGSILCSFCGQRMEATGECISCKLSRSRNQLYRPNCPKCNRKMDDGYLGATTVVDAEIWLCVKDNLKVPKYSKPEQPPSKTTILPLVTPIAEEQKPIPKSESKYFQRLTPWKKSEIRAEEKSQGRPKPRNVFCNTCNKDRTTFGAKCPKCHNPI
jgi:hypothetical protein